MRIAFTLPERIIGLAATAAKPLGRVDVMCTEGLTSFDGAAVTMRLEALHSVIFTHIPGLPPPSLIDHLLVVIGPDLKATAYVNELRPVAMVRPNKVVGSAGQTIFGGDVDDVLSFDVGVDVPADCGFVLVHSFAWRKAVFFDLCPLLPDSKPREYDIRGALARQTLELLTRRFDASHGPQREASTPAGAPEREATETAGAIPVAISSWVVADRFRSLRQGLEALKGLLTENCNDESKYQEFFERYPWILGNQHTLIERHTKLDDENIPDFTGVRSHDLLRDVFEIKPPFTRCFRKDGGFTQFFNDTWAQGVRYLTFVRENSDYLRRKGLLFANPRCYIVLGHGFSQSQFRRLKDHEAMAQSIVVLTYENVLAHGTSLLKLLGDAREER